MIKQKEWQFPQMVADTEVTTLMQQLALPKLAVQLCLARGLKTKAAIEKFIKMDETCLHDPFAFATMDKVVTRIKQAIDQREAILVCGDYDVDGMSATTIVIQTLRQLGAEVDFIIPNRFIDGYGMNERIVDEAHERGAKVIITVDNGIAALDAVKHANSLAIDVIITDHHDAQAQLPQAYAILHPKLDETYPFQGLSGGGVAFKLAQALLPTIPDEFYAYAALSTVADMVPLTDENHYLVKRGLEVLKTTQNLGLKQLIRVCGLAQDCLDEESIGFYMGPRMNAAGRLDDAAIVVELFLTDDEYLAEDIANELQSLNEQRQQLVNEITEQAISQLEQQQTQSYRCLVHASTYNHKGVAGIVATRLMHHFNKPVMSFVIDETTKLATGSARAFGELHLMELLEAVAPLLTRFGGHQHAAGITLPVENLEALQVAIQEYMEQHDVKCVETIEIDLITTLEDISVEAIQALDLLAPFGIGNPKPIVCIPQLSVAEAKTMGAENNHLKMQVMQVEQSLDVVGFKQGALVDYVQAATYLDVVGTLNVNTWRNIDKPQLMLQTLQTTKQTIDYCLPPTTLAADEVFIQAVPQNLETLATLLQDKAKILIHERFYHHRQVIRQDFIVVYRLIQQYDKINQLELERDVWQRLQLSKAYLNSILTVFSELNFVIIDDGVIQFRQLAQKVELDQSPMYRKLMQQQRLATILRQPNNVRLFIEHGIKGEF
ncbi:MAG: single-stranded-DNA-specific exonuclease RecJ [Culicoidibacterales bacterium]